MEVTPLTKPHWIGAFDAVDPTVKGSETTTQIIHAVRRLNKAEFMGENRDLKFTRDEETHRQIVQIVNREGKELEGSRRQNAL